MSNAVAVVAIVSVVGVAVVVLLLLLELLLMLLFISFCRCSVNCCCMDLWSLPDHLFYSFWTSIASPTHVRTPCFDHPGSYASFLSEWVVTTTHTVISLRTIWFD